ncbi:MAG TPA: hypothetical protein VL527_07435 [Dongiaceae bacterium]|jgi:hypothetical protein|nr:hypothetical protein [Dongiaceae bacterium]
MGLLNLFPKAPGNLTRLPSGCFTVDRTGEVVASTLPQSFSAELVGEIATQVLATFRDAQAAHLPLTELVVRYASLKITARELRGGAIVFLTPQTLAHTQN